jgi:hypothetical protein
MMMANESTKEEEEQTREERKSDSQCPHMHFMVTHGIFGIFYMFVCYYLYHCTLGTFT